MLYSYTMSVDAGSAPNPYWGVCTLVICKPAIRRTARVGDWIVGLGSASSPIGDIAEHVVYAMRVSQVMTMREYDAYCRKRLPRKIPDWSSDDYRHSRGDCLYDFEGRQRPRMRRGVHGIADREHDLGGRNALLSDHFYYFGRRPVRLPKSLHPIIHKRGHKSVANEPCRERFVEWLEGLGHEPNVVLAPPQCQPVEQSERVCAPGARARKAAERRKAHSKPSCRKVPIGGR